MAPTDHALPSSSRSALEELVELEGFSLGDWRPTPLPPLAALCAFHGAEWEAASREMTGPTSRTNWIIRAGDAESPGALLCGDEPRTEAQLRALVAAGVSTCFNLTQRHDRYDYRTQLRRMGHADMSFDEQPLPDQKVVADDVAAAAALRLLRRVLDGEVVYLHCRGGHGRTGTIASLVLGLAYRLSGAEALATYQSLHDTRASPVFCARGGLEVHADGHGAVSLFPIQREQVIRSKHDSHGPRTKSKELASSSSEFTSRRTSGGGPSSKYSLTVTSGSAMVSRRRSETSRRIIETSQVRHKHVSQSRDAHARAAHQDSHDAHVPENRGADRDAASRQVLFTVIRRATARFESFEMYESAASITSCGRRSK